MVVRRLDVQSLEVRRLEVKTLKLKRLEFSSGLVKAHWGSRMRIESRVERDNNDFLVCKH